MCRCGGRDFAVREALRAPGHGASIGGMLINMQARKLHYVVYEQDGAYVAQCLDVDVASEGDTEAEAVSNLGEALALYFESDAPTTMPPRALRFGELVVNA